MFDRFRTKEIEVQVTPMLDMAFQILAFFIMTYNPMPLEGQFAMNLLPTTPQVDAQPAPSESDEPEEPEIDTELKTIRTRLKSNPAGLIDRMSIGEVEVEGMDAFRARLIALVRDSDLPFDRAEILADPNLHYAELISVVDAFMAAEISNISFGELEPFELGGPAL